MPSLYNCPLGDVWAISKLVRYELGCALTAVLRTILKSQCAAFATATSLSSRHCAVSPLLSQGGPRAGVRRCCCRCSSRAMPSRSQARQGTPASPFPAPEPESCKLAIHASEHFNPFIGGWMKWWIPFDRRRREAALGCVRPGTAHDAPFSPSMCGVARLAWASGMSPRFVRRTERRDRRW